MKLFHDFENQSVTKVFLYCSISLCLGGLFFSAAPKTYEIVFSDDSTKLHKELKCLNEIEFDVDTHELKLKKPQEDKNCLR